MLNEDASQTVFHAVLGDLAGSLSKHAILGPLSCLLIRRSTANCRPIRLRSLLGAAIESCDRTLRRKVQSLLVCRSTNQPIILRCFFLYIFASRFACLCLRLVYACTFCYKYIRYSSRPLTSGWLRVSTASNRLWAQRPLASLVWRSSREIIGSCGALRPS